MKFAWWFVTQQIDPNLPELPNKYFYLQTKKMFRFRGFQQCFCPFLILGVQKKMYFLQNIFWVFWHLFLPSSTWLLNMSLRKWAANSDSQCVGRWLVPTYRRGMSYSGSKKTYFSWTLCIKLSCHTYRGFCALSLNFRYLLYAHTPLLFCRWVRACRACLRGRTGGAAPTTWPASPRPPHISPSTGIT